MSWVKVGLSYTILHMCVLIGVLGANDDFHFHMEVLDPSIWALLKSSPTKPQNQAMIETEDLRQKQTHNGFELSGPA